MLNITAIQMYYDNKRYNDELKSRPGASAEAILRWLRPEDREGALNFGTKEEYLQWVKEWKETYKSLSQRIRSLKRARKLSSEPFEGFHGEDAKLEAGRERRKARTLLFARAEAKIRSQELRDLRLKIEKAS